MDAHTPICTPIKPHQWRNTHTNTHVWNAKKTINWGKKEKTFMWKLKNIVQDQVHTWHFVCIYIYDSEQRPRRVCGNAASTCHYVFFLNADSTKSKGNELKSKELLLARAFFFISFHFPWAVNSFFALTSSNAFKQLWYTIYIHTQTHIVQWCWDCRLERSLT